MEEILIRFDPLESSSGIAVWAGVLVSVIAFGLCTWLFLKKEEGKNRQRNIIIAMLLFFLGMIAAGTSFFTFWTYQKTGPVLIYADAVETTYGKSYFRDIKNASITVAGNKSLVNPNQQRGVTRLLLIEQHDGKAHVLSEENYKIEAILNKLRGAVQEWEKSKE
ncbi:MAG: hypothetical protein KTR30_27970 [Saprospiraceae bacterium]|nr:hypothetical protein [Saprospiraceae bacterium]